MFGDKLPLPHALKHAETISLRRQHPTSLGRKRWEKHEFDDWDGLSKYNIWCIGWDTLYIICY